MSISINLELMILVFFIFIICIFFLSRWLYKPLLEFMDSRELMIKNDMETIDSNYIEIKKINEEINSILATAIKGANDIKLKAMNESKLIYDKKINEAKMLHEKELASFIIKLDKDKEELKHYLLESLPTLKESLAKKLSKNIVKEQS